MAGKRKVHMLRRFGQTVTLCETGAQFRGKRPQPPLVDNDPSGVTCAACKRLIALGQSSHRTLRDIAMNQLQSLFFTSFHHIARQGKPSLNEKGKCCYRSTDGLSCAAAPFIRHYSPNMEDNNFNWLVDQFQKDIDPVAVQHRGFVMELQLAHDEAHRRAMRDPHNRFMTQYIELMRNLAARWSLLMPPAVAMGRSTF